MYAVSPNKTTNTNKHDTSEIHLWVFFKAISPSNEYEQPRKLRESSLSSFIRNIHKTPNPNNNENSENHLWDFFYAISPNNEYEQQWKLRTGARTLKQMNKAQRKQKQLFHHSFPLRNKFYKIVRCAILVVVVVVV